MYYPPTSLVLYNSLDSDLALAYLPTATVMISVVDMIMSLVLDHENKKLILRALNLVHEVECYENGKTLILLSVTTLGDTIDTIKCCDTIDTIKWVTNV